MYRKLIFVLSIASQVTLSQWSASASFMVGAPQGEFADNVGNFGYGLGLTAGYAPSTLPVGAGLKLGFLSYGSESRREPFSTTIPDVMVDVTTNNLFIVLNLEGRIQPNTGLLRPYLSGTFGLNILTTSTAIKNESTGEEVASSTNQKDVAFNYGAGAGLDVRVWERDLDGTDDEVKFNDVSIHAGFTYLRGGEAEYLRKGSIRRVNGQVVYDKLRSKTDIILYTIGVSASF